MDNNAFSNEDGSRFQKPSSIYQKPSLGLSNPSIDDLNASPKLAQNLPYQSSQTKGQFIYSRLQDITTVKTLYSTGVLANNFYTFDSNVLPTAVTLGNYKNDNSFFIWNGDIPTTGSVQGISESGFVPGSDQVYVHCQHPDLFDNPFNITSGAYTTVFDWVYKNATVSKDANQNVKDNPSSYYQQTGYNTPGSLGSYSDITNKISFQENDKYLLGERSCGSYLYLSPLNYDDIRVEGNDKISKKELTSGSSNAVVLQVVYQYRMTDYFGPGKLGIGKVSGKDGVTQLQYTKILGLDIYYDESKFSFDLEVTSRYKSNSISTSDVPSSTFQNTINQTTNNVSQITPSIS